MNDDDIVKRLRSAWPKSSIMHEAADEIERLRECLKEARAAAKAFLRELGRDE